MMFFVALFFSLVSSHALTTGDILPLSLRWQYENGTVSSWRRVGADGCPRYRKRGVTRIQRPDLGVNRLQMQVQELRTAWTTVYAQDRRLTGMTLHFEYAPGRVDRIWVDTVYERDDVVPSGAWTIAHRWGPVAGVDTATGTGVMLVGALLVLWTMILPMGVSGVLLHSKLFHDSWHPPATPGTTMEMTKDD